MDNLLKDLRQRIDELDYQLMDIIKHRLSLVREIYSLKAIKGLAVFDAEREKEVIALLKSKAIEQGLSPDFFQDIIQRIMRESYLQANLCPMHKTNPDIRKIVIVGAKGKMGTLFANQFKLSGYSIQEIDKENAPYTANEFKDAGLVLICVPIDNTLNVISSLPELPEGCVLADITSIKSKPIQAMIKAHKGPVLGLHPMFGPQIKTFANQLIVSCGGQEPEKYEWLIKQLEIWGARIETCTPEKHDELMAYIQALNHFTMYILGSFLLKEQIGLDLLLHLSSPNYKALLALVKRLFNQSPELYLSIFNASENNASVANRYIEHFNHALQTVCANDKEQYIDDFDAIKKALEKIEL